MSDLTLPLVYQDIVRLLPHRYPFLLIDRITEIELGKNIVGIKNVTANEPFFQGHFPGNPIMPGVLIIEAMAQAGGILARLSLNGLAEKENTDSVFFMTMDKVKFRRPVVPGDQLRLDISTLRSGSRVWKMEGKAFVEQYLVAEAVLAATIA
jgi:beta-hydroxyacyl-ACP dehydratase FabZ